MLLTAGQRCLALPGPYSLAAFVAIDSCWSISAYRFLRIGAIFRNRPFPFCPRNFQLGLTPAGTVRLRATPQPAKRRSRFAEDRPRNPASIYRLSRWAGHGDRGGDRNWLLRFTSEVEDAIPVGNRPPPQRAKECTPSQRDPPSVVEGMEGHGGHISRYGP
jgi:hypothetical protein